MTTGVGKFKKLCKHAQFEIDNKVSYSEQEAEGGCWKCGKPLTLQKKHIHTSIDDVNMDEESRKSLDTPDKVINFLNWINQPRYECNPCFMALLEDRKKGPFIPIEDVIADWENPEGKWKTRQLEQIKEVKECGPDCPYWDRLAVWKKNVETSEIE